MSAALLLVTLSLLPYVHAVTNAQNASLVIGEPDFTTGGVGESFCIGPPAKPVTPTRLCGPFGITFDKHGNLWVSDEDNSRILKFKAPFHNGEAASLVLGQPNMTINGCHTTQNGLCDPRGIAFDREGDLWVADEGNNRIVSYEAPFHNGQNAAEVVGHKDFTSKTCSQAPDNLCSPSGIAFDESGRLWVADQDNNRVLMFKENLSSGENATLALGQSDLKTGNCNTTRSGLCAPASIAFDHEGNLWVGDDDNHRILSYEEPFKTGMNATTVIGQSSFTTSHCRVTQDGICSASGIAFDHHGSLWVVDHNNHRVIKYPAPLVTGENASRVIGQSSFTTNTCATTQSGLCEPSGVAFDHHGHLWITDDENNRVTEYKISHESQDDDREFEDQVQIHDSSAD